MSLWPFSRKRPRSGALSDLEASGIIEPTTAPAPVAPFSSGQHGAPSTTASLSTPAPDAIPRHAPKKRRTDANSPKNKMNRRPGGQNPPSASRGSTRMAPETPALNEEPARRMPRTTFAATEPRTNDIVAPRSGGDGDPHRTPTLHGGRDSAQSKKSRRSSRRSRKSADADAGKSRVAHDAPNRPATETWQSGRPMNKDSKVIRSGFGFGRNSECSVISLPTRDSIHRSLSSDSEHDFRVSTLEALAPRPTLRRSGPPYKPSASRAASRRKTLGAPISAQTLKAHKRVDSLADNLDASELRELMERDKRRRDRKQQRDRDRVEARLSRRAAAQREEVERARQMGLSPPRNYDRGVMGRELEGLRPPSPIWAPRRDSDAAAEEIHIPRFSFQEERPTDAQPQPPQPTEQPQPREQPQPTEQLRSTQMELAEQQPAAQSGWEGPTMMSTETEPQQPRQTPELTADDGRAARVSADSTPPVISPTIEPEPQGEQADEQQQQQAPTPPASPRVSAINILRRKQSASRSSLASEQGKFTVVKPPRLDDTNAAPSPAGSSKPERNKSRRLALSTFFRWPSRNRAPATPQSSFSNTSRGEIMAANLQMQAQARPLATSQSRETITVRRMGSNAPKRTRSRFKEDLPEHPMSPPPSRLQSPEAGAGTNDDSPSMHPYGARSHEFFSVQPMPRPGTSTSGHRSIETVRNTPVSWQHRTNSTEPPVSASFASVDSEASWFSGRMGTGRKSPVSRTVSRATHHRSLNYSLESLHDEGMEDHIMDDDYITRFSSLARHDTVTNRESVGEARPSSDEEDMVMGGQGGHGGEDEEEDHGSARWGAVEARQQPRVVTGRQGLRIQSYQGVVADTATEAIEAEIVDDNDASSDTHHSIISTGSVVLSRARSILLGKGQARPISIGSANLLDVTQDSTEKRSSSERRRSTGSRT